MKMKMQLSTYVFMSFILHLLKKSVLSFYIIIFIIYAQCFLYDNICYLGVCL